MISINAKDLSYKDLNRKIQLCFSYHSFDHSSIFQISAFYRIPF